MALSAAKSRLEELYYSAKFEDIYVYCSGPVDPWSMYIRCNTEATYLIINN